MSMQRFFPCILSVFLLFAVLTPIAIHADEPTVDSADAPEAIQVINEEVDGTAPARPSKAEILAELASLQAEAEAAEEEVEEPKSYFSGKFWALVPPILAILLALITKEVYSSLFIGVCVGGLFVAEGHFLKFMDVIINDGLIAAVQDTAGVFIFLVTLGILVALMNRTGAAQAFGEWAQKHVKSRVGAALMTFVLGVLIFIDDYFNCLTVGSVMLPVTDSKRISRAKLSYLIDATAAPICMIAPISSWAAAVASYSEGTGYNGITLFCKAIPFNFYSLLTIVFVLAITLLKIDFGPMAKHERNAIEKGDLFTEGKEVDSGFKAAATRAGTINDLVLPVLLLIVICFFALLYNGGYFAGEGKSFIDSFGDTDATVALPWGGLLTLVLVILYYIGRNLLTHDPNRPFMPFVIGSKDAMECVATGFNAMVPAILVLTLATTLKNMTGALEAKEFIAGLMSDKAASLHGYLPCVIFLVACVLSFATGTSWGTFGILIPIVVNIFPPSSPLLYIGMSACLAGAVCGDHCSPISDTTIMSSAGAKCQHINHVSTQLPYAIFVAGFSFLSFLIAGFITNWFVVFPISVILMLGTLFIIKSKMKTASKTAE
ncbi:MAG: Na+/H+ antiporter NhaC family protein [Victivallales bacterium]|nr:Na+/H+ antiporter NhaC family protein [Victivallales bacterium]